MKNQYGRTDERFRHRNYTPETVQRELNATSYTGHIKLYNVIVRNTQTCSGVPIQKVHVYVSTKDDAETIKG